MTMKIYLVGGAVRDLLLGHPSKDRDFVVIGATPEEMLAKGFQRVGADFPVFLSPDGTEYALARTERKSGTGYNGFVTEHGPEITLEQDLERRDLTINAMAVEGDPRHWTLNERNKVVDPFKGYNDLCNKVLRHVSPAFAEDPVRVLRLARFRARYGKDWTIAPETLAFCRQMVESGELASLTRERVLKEMEKAMAEKSPYLFLQTLQEVGALAVVFPELAEEKAFHKATYNLMSYPTTNPLFNYAKMVADIESETVTEMEYRLRVSNDYRAYAKMFRLGAAVTRTPMVERLYHMDIFRRSKLWESLVADLKKDGAYQLVELVNEAYEAVKHVCFETLPEGVRNELKGSQIADSIKRQRVFAYETYRKNRQ